MGEMRKNWGKICGAILYTTDLTKSYQELNLRLCSERQWSMCAAWSEVNLNGIAAHLPEVIVEVCKICYGGET
jgi:hypothetical protein